MVKGWRDRMVCNQAVLADLLGVHPTTVAHWELGALTPTSWQKALGSALAASPAASEVPNQLRAAGLPAALAVGLEYVLKSQ